MRKNNEKSAKFFLLLTDGSTFTIADSKKPKMATVTEKSFCVLEYARVFSTTTVQRAFRIQYGKQSPTRKSILRWYKQFKETGCLCKKKSSGRPSLSNDAVEKVRESFVRSPRKSTRVAGRELGMPHQTVWKVLRTKLQFKPYRLQLLQQITENDKVRRLDFCERMLMELQNPNFGKKLVFSDESTFHLSGHVNRHNVRVWGSENPHQFQQFMRDSPKVNVFCAMSCEKIYGPFFFGEKTVTGDNYLDMLEIWLFPQLLEDSPDFIFQQDGAPPHWSLTVRSYLNNLLPQRWIGRACDDDLTLLTWPPRSPDLTPCDFFLWGYVKDRVFVQPMPNTLPELKQRISAALQTITRNMLQNVWNELDYRLDVCRVTKGSHIEHL